MRSFVGPVCRSKTVVIHARTSSRILAAWIALGTGKKLPELQQRS